MMQNSDLAGVLIVIAGQLFHAAPFGQPMASCGSATLTGVALRQLGRAGLALA
jgi:hypothetical protein